MGGAIGLLRISLSKAAGGLFVVRDNARLSDQPALPNAKEKFFELSEIFGA
jgi:hypothetical protein